MPMKRLLPPLIAGVVVFIATESFAQTLISRSQLRRTVDPSERSASGTIILTVTAEGRQIMQTHVTGLAVDSFALFYSPYSTPTTDCCIYALAPLDRANSKKGTWTRRLAGTGGAPPELERISILDLGDLDGQSADIAEPAANNLVQQITNVVGNVTNIITGILVPTPEITNSVNSILWAPLYAPTANPGAGSYVRKGTMAPPEDVPPPSPGAKAKITVRFKGPQGDSVFDIQASKLTRGQVYHVYVADRTNQDVFVLIDAGTMTTSKSGATARFLRDTKFGDPLPQQARDAGDLSGRVVEIRDEFGDFIHLVGLVP